jgi:hypothetical protein
VSPWLANLGGEEPGLVPPPIAAHAGALFSLLFAATAESRARWPKALDPPADAPAFGWLDEAALHAWLNTEVAAARAGEIGVPLAGAASEIVRRVHDKAFSFRFAREHGFEARSLRGVGSVWEPQVLETDDAAERIRAEIEDWPAWTGQRFTLKPRFGGSGRGRFGGDSTTSKPAIARALPRLAARGGALLEPWVERTGDLSAQLHVAPDGSVTLLGTLVQDVSDSGVYRGHRGRLDHRHRVTSGHAQDGALLEAAIATAGAAHAEGFHGPCGIDAFTFRAETGEELRPICEFNARFTLGTIVIGVLRRARARIERALGPAPGSALEFEFALDTRGVVSSPQSELLLPLAPGVGPFCACLRVRRAAADIAPG